MAAAITTGKLAYQNPQATVTLREGLAQYYASNPDLIDPSTTSTTVMSSYFANHDASHVVFGTSTAIDDEVIQDIWTLFAVDIKYRRYIAELATAKEAVDVIKSLPLVETVKAIFHVLRLTPLLFRRSRRMPKKWPWSGWEKHLDQPLDRVREEYGIQVLSV